MWLMDSLSRLGYIHDITQAMSPIPSGIESVTILPACTFVLLSSSVLQV